MDNNFNRVRLCGRAAGEPALSHINHGEHFYRFPLSVERLSFSRFPLSVERLSGQEDLLPVILPRRLLEEHPVHTGDTLTLTGQLRSFNNRSGQGPRLVISVFVRELTPGGAAPFNQIQLSGVLCKAPSLRRTPLGRGICAGAGGGGRGVPPPAPAAPPPVRAGGLSALHRLGGHRPADGPASGGFPPDGGGPGPEPGLYENRGRRGPGAHRL
ncbi:putative uncharacterized protein [Oscillibacter sp. CAG:241]|nr:putative uncharacterized protein [Oscillibacter sp. CAG:241]